MINKTEENQIKRPVKDSKMNAPKSNKIFLTMGWLFGGLLIFCAVAYAITTVSDTGITINGVEVATVNDVNSNAAIKVFEYYNSTSYVVNCESNANKLLFNASNILSTSGNYTVFYGVSWNFTTTGGQTGGGGIVGDGYYIKILSNNGQSCTTSDVPGDNRVPQANLAFTSPLDCGPSPIGGNNFSILVYGGTGLSTSPDTNCALNNQKIIVYYSSLTSSTIAGQ